MRATLLVLLVAATLIASYQIRVTNPYTYDLRNVQVRVRLTPDLINKPISIYYQGSQVDFCYETASGCSTDYSSGDGYIWIKVPYLPAGGTVYLEVTVGNNGASSPNEVFNVISDPEKHTLYNAHHNPTTYDIYSRCWNDAGRDAFDCYGYTYLSNDPINIMNNFQIDISTNGFSYYTIDFDGRRYLVIKDLLPNQYGNPTVLRIVLIPMNEEAWEEAVGVHRYGNLGSDGSTHSATYSFYCDGVRYVYAMSWDWSSSYGSGDPNIWYFMFSVDRDGDASESYSISRSGDNFNEYLRNAKGIIVMYLSPSDNALGDYYISQLLCNEIRYFKTLAKRIVFVDPPYIYTLNYDRDVVEGINASMLEPVTVTTTVTVTERYTYINTVVKVVPVSYTTVVTVTQPTLVSITTYVTQYVTTTITAWKTTTVSGQATVIYTPIIVTSTLLKLITTTVFITINTTTTVTNWIIKTVYSTVYTNTTTWITNTITLTSTIVDEVTQLVVKKDIGIPAPLLLALIGLYLSRKRRHP